MNKLVKILFVLVLFNGATALASADRGGFGHRRSRVHLNIPTFNSLKRSITFNLKSGLTYRGSMVFDKQQVGNTFYNSTLITYKKGNTVYIMPYKQKILIPEYKPSTGYKLIIRP